MTETVVSPAGTPPSSGRRHWPRGAVVVGLLGVAWLLFGVAGGPYQGKLSSVQKNDNAAYLPSSAESTKVDTESQRFQDVQTIPGFLVYQRTGGLTPADRSKIASDAAALATLPGVAGDQVKAPVYASDGATANVAAPLVAKRGSASVDGSQLTKVEKNVLATARTGAPAGLVIHSAGPGGLLVAFIDAFKGIDGSLLLAAGVVVIGILLVVYRSPVLWFFPLFSAVLALGAASLVIYALAKNNVLTLNGQSQGILSVLVLGAGTDYALLLVSRYREELHNYESRVEAMVKAWRRAATAIAASGTTVILGLLCLGFGELNSDRSLGPVCAIGIACTLGVMLTFLPLFLTVVPRGVFWPRVPRADHEGDPTAHGAWSRFAHGLAGRDRVAWIVTAVVLLACVSGLTTLKTGGLSTADSFTNNPDAIVGQKVFNAHFPHGTGAPAVISAESGTVPDVIAAVSKVPGVSTATGSVCVQADYAKLAGSAKNPGAVAAAARGCVPSSLAVAPHNGRLLVNATLNDNYDSPTAYSTVQHIRSVVHAIPGAHVLVGGQSAINYDTQQASRHDRNLIIPVVLVVILIVLGLLLRALVAPLLLIATVVLSFSAALVFNHVFGFANADPGFPLFAFVFLVALGVDYNIFLMTRVREETLAQGTREGVMRGLAVTGGVSPRPAWCSPPPSPCSASSRWSSWPSSDSRWRSGSSSTPSWCGPSWSRRSAMTSASASGGHPRWAVPPTDGPGGAAAADLV